MPHPSNDLVGYPVPGRPPTSHEQRSGQSWDASYQNGPAPWDIGQPQPALACLASRFVGPVLDAGCGTGEHALLAASLSLPVLGVDIAETALAMARQKAHDRGLSAEFAAADAFHLDRLGRKFRTILDSGLFHTFNAKERPDYVASLASVAEPGAALYVLCFSDAGPVIGPHPISRKEIEAAFHPATGWKIAGLAPDRIQTRMHAGGGAPAWLATVHRL